MIGIFLIVAAIVLPTATLPFITEYHPEPEICLTSNFFSNLGNMTVHVIPYRYLFVLGVILGCIGIAVLALSVKFFAANRARRVGVITVLAGLCLPVITMPYITEFLPHPEVCLSSNFFGNFSNMIVNIPFISFPYRYLFSFGIIAACIGIGTVILSSDKPAGIK